MFKWIVLVFLLVFVAAPAAFVGMALESQPRVPPKEPATAADAKRTNEIFREFRALTEAPEDSRTLVVTEADLNSALNFATRAIPAIRGQADVLPFGVVIDGSLRLPVGGWLNATIEVPRSDAGLALSYLQVGPMTLPPGIVIPIVRTALNLVLGDSLGDIAVRSIDTVAIEGDRVAINVAMTYDERKALAFRAKGVARQASGMATPEQVRRYYIALEEAARNGEVSPTGSFAHFLRHAVSLAAEHAASGDAKREMEAALMAVAIQCGHTRFQEIVGEVSPADLRSGRTVCDSATLAGRGDLRRHFALSAGLKIASDAGMAFAIGEFKELLDSAKGGSGFSFDDIAADRAGIRFAVHILSVDPSDWDAVIRRIGDEGAVFPSIEGLPSHMPEPEFMERFGGVDTPRYRDMLREIDSRIDALPVYRAG